MVTHSKVDIRERNFNMKVTHYACIVFLFNVFCLNSGFCQKTSDGNQSLPSTNESPESAPSYSSRYSVTKSHEEIDSANNATERPNTGSLNTLF